jgi:hypothetical protein
MISGGVALLRTCVVNLTVPSRTLRDQVTKFLEAIRDA